MSLSPVLHQILMHKWEEVRHQKKIFSLAALEDAAAEKADGRRPFAAAFATGAPGFKVIAEIKRSSPSQCYIPTGFDPVQIAKSYQAAGAACLSVLTEDRFFMGSSLYIPLVKEAVDIPVLRKDFVVDPWQVAEAAALGADAALLMAVLYEDCDQLAPFFQMADKVGIELLVEIHSEKEWELVKPYNPPLVGINNRDFRSAQLELDVETSVRLAPLLPKETIVISESGLSAQGQLGRLASLGVDGFLIGSAFMKSGDPGGALRALLAD
ncbi:MAG: indole-3-glycerol phosphate synthase TrpC [Nitrospinota bacterium]|nr:indole-3-glycerol phosphate synthase TrpC [Nitrospinota bacterium]